MAARGFKEPHEAENAGRKRDDVHHEGSGHKVGSEHMVDEKRAQFEARAKQADAFAKSHFPEGAQLCGRCSTAAVVMMDGCMTCLNCGDSKCG